MPAISKSESCMKPPPPKHVVMDSKDAEGNLPRSENRDNKTDAIPSIEKSKTKRGSRDPEESSALAALHVVISDQGEATRVEQEVCHKDATTSTKKPDSLRRRLMDIRTEAPIGSWKFFFPNDGVRRLIVPNKIQTELTTLETDYTECELDDHAKIIHNKSPRLFAILVFLKLSRYIYDFISEGIDDADLPFLRCDKSAFILCSNKSQRKRIECMKDWDSGDVEEFNRTQYSMLSPVFDFGDEVQHQDLPDGCILPFIEDYGQGKNYKATEGGYGLVWKIKIHPAHQISSNQEDSEVGFPSRTYVRLRLTNIGSLLFSGDKTSLFWKWIGVRIRGRNAKDLQKEKAYAFNQVVGHLSLLWSVLSSISLRRLKSSTVLAKNTHSRLFFNNYSLGTPAM